MSYLSRRFEMGDPPRVIQVYVDDGQIAENIESLGHPPFDYQSIEGVNSLEVSFDPPLNEQDKAGAFSPDAIARTMNVGSVAIAWDTRPSKDYGKPDHEFAKMSVGDQGWNRGLLEQFLAAVEQNARR